MLMIEICERFHWDYYTYMQQPLVFIDLIVKKMEIDAKKQKAANKNKR